MLYRMIKSLEQLFLPTEYEYNDSNNTSSLLSFNINKLDIEIEKGNNEVNIKIKDIPVKRGKLKYNNGKIYIEIDTDSKDNNYIEQLF